MERDEKTQVEAFKQLVEEGRAAETLPPTKPPQDLKQAFEEDSPTELADMRTQIVENPSAEPPAAPNAAQTEESGP